MISPPASAVFANCFTDPIHADYSENGLPAAVFARSKLVGIVREALSGYSTTQHLSPNHVIEFHENDPDRAICHSYMYAQHRSQDSGDKVLFLLRGSYTNHMLRTAEGWRIEKLVQHVSWAEDTINP